MNKSNFKKIIKECIFEVLTKNVSDTNVDNNNPHSNEANDVAKKIWPGKVYSVDLYPENTNPNLTFFKVKLFTPIGENHWLVRKEDGKWEVSMGSGEQSSWKPVETFINEMSTSTGGVQGFLSKNWVDPDPKRKKMSNIAAKSVGGKVV